MAALAARLESASPWSALRVIGNPALYLIDALQQLHIETYYPVVRETRPVPRRKLSHAQRASGAVILRPRDVPFLAGVVFVRGEPMGHRRSMSVALPRDVRIGDRFACEAATPLDWDDVFELRGVLGFVASGDAPVQIADAAIAQLRAREVGGVIAGRTPARMIFRVGEKVGVTHGPFTMSEGTIAQVPDVAIEDIDGETRLKLTIDIFGRSTLVELSAWQIEKL